MYFAPDRTDLVVIMLNQRSRAGVENEGEVKDANQGGRTVNNDGIRISAVGCITDLYQEQTMRN